MPKKYILIIFVFLLICIVAVLYKMKSTNKDIDEIAYFNYISGSSGYSIELKGIRNGNLFEINCKEYSGGNQDTKKLTVTFEDFKRMLDATTIEDCKKHTYEYQCGDSNGCAYSEFSVGYSNSDGDKACYKINNDVSNFFKQLIG